MGGSNGGEKQPRSLEDRFVELQLDEDRVREILDRRASALAKMPDEDHLSGQVVQYASFKIGAERYGIEVRFVNEIQPLRDLTMIPCTPDFVVGAVNIRGRIIPVVDLKIFFGIPKELGTASNKVIVIQVDDIHLGVLADSVEDVQNLSSQEIDSQLLTLSGAQEEFIRGVSDSQIIILDIEALAKDRRMVVHENV